MSLRFKNLEKKTAMSRRHRSNKIFQRANLQIERLEDRSVMSATALSSFPAEDAPATPVLAATMAAAETAPIAELLSVEEWVQSLTESQLHLVLPQDVKYIKTTQLASLKDAGLFNLWPDASRAALQPAQVQALNIGALGITRLTLEQTSWLTAAQVQQIKWNEFHYLSPLRVPYLTAPQLQTLKDLGTFRAWTPEARAALQPAQVQALDIDALGIAWLTPQQITWLTPAQIHQVEWKEFHRLPASQVGNLTTAQLASLKDAGLFNLWPEASRAALQPAQVQALNIGALGITRLTLEQTSWLTAAQVQQIKWNEFHYLSPLRVPYLTAPQLQTLKDAGTFGAWTEEARSVLQSWQLQALDVNALGVSQLTTAQIAWLTPAQISQIKRPEELYRLPPSQIPRLSIAQIQQLEGMHLGHWSADSRAALTQIQVQALRIEWTGVHLLTQQQVSWLSGAQVQRVTWPYFELLTPAQIPYLTIAQIKSLHDVARFRNWSQAARDALTFTQTQALDIAAFGIELLNTTHVGWLTKAQVQSISYREIGGLQPFQIPYLSIAQMQSIPRGVFLFDLPVALQMAFTREQLLALPSQVLADYAVDSYPTSYHPQSNGSVGPDGLPNSVHHLAEAAKVFALVPLNAATHTTVASGNWSDSRIWKDGKIPSAGAKVVVAAGTTVTFDAYQNEAMKTLRIDGTLAFATNRNTQLKADTIVVYSTGRLFVGTSDRPIQDNVTARILIADNGPIDRVWDPYMFSRGIISRGEVKMYGRTTTSYAAAANDLMAGATKINLSVAPTGWRVGDKIVIAGDNQMLMNAGAEERTILAINGSTVTVEALRLNHVAPQDFGGFIHVANLSRNIEIMAEDDSVVAQRPHMMFMHNANVNLNNIGVYGFGRTDKSQPINDPVVVNGVLQAGTGMNPRARYSIHFHHTGVNPTKAPAEVSGSVVYGSAGWGYVNHSSNVNFDNNVAYQVHGASFTGEDGNEIGAMRGNLSVSAMGTYGDIVSRSLNHDFGFEGHGFWLQGPGISLENNISAGSRGSAYVLFMSSTKNLFDAVNLPNPALAGGQDAVPVGSVPLKQFYGNVAYAAKNGLEIWKHMQVMNDGDGVIHSFTAWNISSAGIDVHYSGRLKIRNARLLSTAENYASGVGINTNFLTQGITIEDSVILGFQVGVKAPVRRTTSIIRGYIAAAIGIDVEKGEATDRVVNIKETMFKDLPAAVLIGRTQKHIYLHAPYDFGYRPARREDSLYAEDFVYYSPDSGGSYRLYFNEQTPAFVPFTASNAVGYVPMQYLGLTNQQLRTQFGLVLRGGMTPANAIALSDVVGGVGVAY
jgi:hypothetical protein